MQRIKEKVGNQESFLWEIESKPLKSFSIRDLEEKLFFSEIEFYSETTTNTLMKKYALILGVPEDKIVTEISDGESSTQGESQAN